MSAKRVEVVVNPAAGQPQPILHTLNQVFGEAGIRWDVSITQEPGDGTRLAREALERGADVVAACGGDGTVMEVGNALVGSRVPLAILPGGTGDVLAVELGIPPVLADAARLACSPDAVERHIDAGQVGDHYFLLRLVLGFTARQIGLTTRELRDRFGKLAYLIAGFQALGETAPARYRLSLDGQEEEYEAVTGVVANAGRLGIYDLTISPHTAIDDGLLDVLAVRSMDLASLSSVVASIVAATPDQANLGYWQGREIRIESDPPQPVVIDGEDCGETPIEITVMPGALIVLVPPVEESAGQEAEPLVPEG
ncbi:MAG: diacylglycerol kinase family lipid kinase [Anaerolineae bacterium]|nr:diacylglycerol kinase family lipid kinase [Anaerolineae bacterium]MDX9830670.1 diacylglycerol kinase family lipid kinase [Anaerolineae bacterium]